jgi:hypothetical protein
LKERQNAMNPDLSDGTAHTAEASTTTTTGREGFVEDGNVEEKRKI